MHISLDSALGRQRRLNQVGETISSIAAPTAGYSLRSLTGGDPRVVGVRRAIDNEDRDFTASQVSSGALLDFVNKIQTLGTAVNGTGSVANYTVTNVSTTGFSADNSAGGVGSAGFPYVFKNGDILVVKYTVTNFSSTSGLSPELRGTNSTGSTAKKASGGTVFTANGTYTDTLTATADGTHLMFADGNTGSYTISDFQIVSHSSNGFVHTWYDQFGDNDAVQGTDGSQPKIVDATDGLLADGITFDGSDDVLTSGFNSSLTNYTFAGVYTVKTIIDNTGFLGKGAGSSDREFFVRMKANGTIEHRIHSTGSASPFFQTVSDATISANTTFLLAGLFKNSTNGLRLDISNTTKTGTSSIGLHSGTSSLTIPSALGNEAHAAIKELLFYSSDQTSKLSDIRTNINNYYSIF